jgi:hypothetical protein
MLQHPKVIVDLLPRQAQRGRQLGRRRRLGQSPKQLAPERLQGGPDPIRVVDKARTRDGHAVSLAFDKSVCQM